ncbi:hypothetical protein BCR42DRAFT_458465 [Absidia repens]|uniref:DDT domain-containing protein n=1 Tax=Absidia repens TaxID=90262 RepID=A0A1X2IZ44_9FUNG|nr:hypothetical protein BCR42DRAFT_458465 [Absidia repens]
MPLLKRKPFELIPPPALDLNDKVSKNSPVWEYLHRTALYKRPLWQCECTGRSSLSYAEALESERSGKPKAKNKLPEALQKPVLERAQFQKTRLDAVVEDVYNFFVNRYVSDENVDCVWDDAPPLEDQTSDEMEYKVQLLDENHEGMEEYIKNTCRKDIKRGRLDFSKSLIKRFLRDATIKETYMGAPWIVSEQFAERFSIDTALPHDLEVAKTLAYSKSRKLRSLVDKTSATASAPTEKSRLEEARKLESLLKYPMEDLDLPIYRRNPPLANSTIFMDMAPGSGNEFEQVPNPTGDLPVRPQPSHETVASDSFGTFLMVWSFLNVFSRPLHLSPFNLTDFESALRHTSVHQKSEMVYEVIAALLNCIIRHRRKSSYQPSPLSLRDIIASSTGYPRASLLATSREHVKLQNGTVDHSPVDKSSNISDDGNSNQQNEYKAHMNGSQRKAYHVCLDRGCASDEVINIGKNWDARPIPCGKNRHGWEDVLIGCINDLAIESDENMTVYDTILCALVPGLNSTLEQRERAYLELGLKEKLTILQLLVNAANETSDINQAERNELEKQFEDASNTETGTEGSESGDDSDNDTHNGDNIDQVQKEAAHLSRHESRQTLMKRKQKEREELEAKRKKVYHQQRQEARERNRELKIRAIARNKLDNQEQLVQKKYEQVNRDMRKYSTLRFKPLGRDKFYNRYYYLDNIGGGHLHGSGKLFVQSPSVTDLAMLLTNNDSDNDNGKNDKGSNDKDNDDNGNDDTKTTQTSTSSATTAKPDDKNTSTSLFGHRGGISFICQLMEHQGLSDKVPFLKNNIQRMTDDEYLEWWESFDDTDALDRLLEWLNPKGVREYLLKRELQKHLPRLMTGMKKQTSERPPSVPEVARRSTRTMKNSQTSSGSWLSYTNKLAK